MVAHDGGHRAQRRAALCAAAHGIHLRQVRLAERRRLLCLDLMLMYADVAQMGQAYGVLHILGVRGSVGPGEELFEGLPHVSGLRVP